MLYILVAQLMNNKICRLTSHQILVRHREQTFLRYHSVIHLLNSLLNFYLHMLLQVVFLGLHIVTPLISLDLLKYPKLCYDVSFLFQRKRACMYWCLSHEDNTFFYFLQYFSLLSHMLEVYPEMVPQLNAEAFGHVLGTLDFGLHQQVRQVFSNHFTGSIIHFRPCSWR